MILKLSILLIPLFLIYYAVAAQPRHVQGLNMLGVTAGLGKDSKSLGISFQKYVTGDISVCANGIVNWVYFKLSDYHSFVFHPQIHYSLLSNQRQFYFNVNGGLNFGLEQLKSNIFNQKINHIFLGETIGMDIEYFFSSHFKCDLSLEQQFLQLSKISDYQYNFKLGTYVEF